MNLRNWATGLLAICVLALTQHVFTDLLGDVGVQVAFLGFVGKIVSGAAKGVAAGAKGVIKGVGEVGKTVISAAPKAGVGFLIGGPAGAIAGAGSSVLDRLGVPPEQNVTFDPLTGNIVPITPDPRFSGGYGYYTPGAIPDPKEYFAQQINTVRDALAAQVIRLGSAGTTALTRYIAPDGSTYDKGLAIPTDVKNLQRIVIIAGVVLVAAFGFLALRPGRGR